MAQELLSSISSLYDIHYVKLVCSIKPNFEQWLLKMNITERSLFQTPIGPPITRLAGEAASPQSISTPTT